MKTNLENQENKIPKMFSTIDKVVAITILAVILSFGIYEGVKIGHIDPATRGSVESGH
jgi:hypothetical protein